MNLLTYNTTFIFKYLRNNDETNNTSTNYTIEHY